MDECGKGVWKVLEQVNMEYDHDNTVRDNS